MTALTGRTRHRAEVDLLFELAGQCGCEECMGRAALRYFEEVEEALDRGLADAAAVEYVRRTFAMRRQAHVVEDFAAIVANIPATAEVVPA